MDYNKLPTLEDLMGSGFALSEAMSFLAHICEESWTPLRAWSFLLKRETNSFAKFDMNSVSAHIRSVVGDKPIAEVGR